MTDEKVNPKNIEIITRDEPLKIIGCIFYGDPFHSKKGWDVENEIGLTWKRFMNLYEHHKTMIDKNRVNKGRAYEIHLKPEDYDESKKFYVFIGVDVTGFDDVPLDMFCKVFPGMMYAVFTFKGKDVFKGGAYIWEEWLPNSDYEEAYQYLILAYDERFRGLDDEDSEIDYYVPIKRKGTE